MIDIGITKMMMVGAVALIVIGPEKLPRVARTVGMLLGKAQRYVSDVKAEVNRSMELDELKKMKDSVESAARDVEQSIHSEANDFSKQWGEATGDSTSSSTLASDYSVTPVHQHPKTTRRLKRGATPRRYDTRTGARTKALSGAARVARYRPAKPR